MLRLNHPRRQPAQPVLTAVGVVAGTTLQAIADTLLQPVIVLAALAYMLGGSNQRIATFVMIGTLAWSLSPLVWPYIARASRLPGLVVAIAAAMRIAAAAMLALTAWRIDDLSASGIGRNLLIGWILYQVPTAIAAQALSGGQVIAAIRIGFQSSVAWRRLGAIAAAVMAGWAAWSVLDTDIAFERRLQRVLLLAALAILASTWFQFASRTPISFRPPDESRNLATALVSALGNGGFRRFMSFKVLLALVAAVDPFLIVYGFQEFGLDVKYVGFAVLAWAIGQAVGTITCSRWIAVSGPRVPLQLATVFRLLFLLWIISLPTVLESKAYTDRFAGTDDAQRAFAGGFVLLGLAMSVGTAGNQRYLQGITGRNSIGTATTAANAIAAIAGLAPLGVARLLEDYDLDRILWAAAGVTVLALMASGLLVESQVRVRSTSRRWGLNRSGPRSPRSVRVRPES